MEQKIYSEQFKLRIVKEAMDTKINEVVAKRHNLDPVLVTSWVLEYNKRYSTNCSFSRNENNLEKDYQHLKAENEKLVKLLVEKDHEIESFKSIIKRIYHPFS
jgi:transposase